jgi:hypothetical protein
MEHVDDLLSVAQSETGLDDFGDGSFREGLERLLSAIQHEARLSGKGDSAMRRLILRLLSQRLQIEHWYQLHPEIDDETISDPLVGVALPRTGSTVLSSLLAEDPCARSLRRWEAAEPCPPPSTVKGPDARIERARLEVAELSARRKALVPAAGTGPQECQLLTAFDFKSHTLAGFAGHVPSYLSWLNYKANLTSAYTYEKRVLKLLQWGSPARPWRLKAPTHLLYLDHLTRVFPDARFVMIHRDPCEVMVSVSELFTEVARPFSDDIDLHYMGSFNVELWSLGMQRALAFREEADERFYDINFLALQEDPIREVRRLYEWLGQSVTEEFEAGMKRWWRDNGERRQPNVYPEPATFGIDLGAIRALFANYQTRMAEWMAR